MCVCAPVCILCVFRCFFLLGVFLLALSGPGSVLYWAFYWSCGQISRPSTFHRPIMCSEGRDLGGLAETDTRQGRGGGGGSWVVTHSSLGCSPALSVCICLCVCVWDKKGSVTGHQMVTVWAGPQQARKRGTVSYCPFFLSLPRALTHIQQTVRVMGDNGADTNKSAPLG